MRVEACCQALLDYLLPHLDPQRQGHCIDVGVGTFAFYCERFARLGFATVAVEPFPTDRLRAICQQRDIRLVEQCLSDQVGTQVLHLGRFAGVANRNFSSLAADWFGASATTCSVPTLDLTTLIRQIGGDRITALKLDIEGWEPVVIKQLNALPAAQLPAVVMFEYGGGSSRQRGEKGWSPKFLAGTVDCLRTLQQRGYSGGIMVDYAPGTGAKCFDLQAIDLASGEPFYRDGVYGNLICCHHHRPEAATVAELCAPYRGGLAQWLISRLVS